MYDLKGVCETFKEHLASVVAAELQSAHFRKNLAKGLKGVPSLTKTKLNDLIEISDKATITTGDVDKIINEIVPRDPTAEFTKNYEAFSRALAKYRVVSKLQSQADDLPGFRKTYAHYQSVLKTGPDGQTTQFINYLKPILRNTQDMFFHDEAEIPVPVKSAARKRPRDKENIEPVQNRKSKS